MGNKGDHWVSWVSMLGGTQEDVGKYSVTTRFWNEDKVKSDKNATEICNQDDDVVSRMPNAFLSNVQDATVFMLVGLAVQRVSISTNADTSNSPFFKSRLNLSQSHFQCDERVSTREPCPLADDRPWNLDNIRGILISFQCVSWRDIKHKLYCSFSSHEDTKSGDLARVRQDAGGVLHPLLGGDQDGQEEETVEGKCEKK